MSVHLLTGDDESLLAAAVGDLVKQLVGDGDRTRMVDDHSTDDYEVRSLVDAAQTPPFLTDRRIVIGRGVGRFNADDLATLVAYLREPLPSTDLVLTASGGRLAKALTDAVKAGGGLVQATGVSARKQDRQKWLEEQLVVADVRLDHQAVSMLTERLGEDMGRLRGILETLTATFGSGRKLSAEEISPFLGEAGGVPPWDLTDAIDRGDVLQALKLSHRMMHAGERHALQIMAILHGHYVRLMKLDGAEARSEADASELLGVKGFQAGKALKQYQRLGSGGVRRAIDLLAQADLDVRGATEMENEWVMEVLVARLARLTPQTGGSRR
jgi:DNA polymerase-3 subunit delta